MLFPYWPSLVHQDGRKRSSSRHIEQCYDQKGRIRRRSWNPDGHGRKGNIQGVLLDYICRVVSHHCIGRCCPHPASGFHGPLLLRITPPRIPLRIFDLWNNMATTLPEQGGASNNNTSPKRTHKRQGSPSSPTKSPGSKKAKTLNATSKGDQERAFCVTTFGIEFELIFAFHENLLETILSEYNIEADIVKTLEYDQHQQLLGEYGNLFTSNHSHNFGRQYPSWGLQVPVTDAILATNHYRQKYPTSLSEDVALRRYVMEPLLIAKRCLDNKKLPCNVVGWPQSHGSDPVEDYPDQAEDILIRNSHLDYTKWTLTNDDTLIGALKSQVESHLSTQGVSQEPSPHWDSHGIELITPIFTLSKKDEALEQIEKYLAALGDSQSTILPSVWASTHVHIGFDYKASRDISTPLFQHLAYILLLHEDLISKCFPRSRSGITTHVSEVISEPIGQSELEDEAAREDQYVLDMEATYTGIDNVESNLEYFCDQTGVDLNNSPQQGQAIEDHIFQDQGSIFGLIRQLQKSDPHQNAESEYDAPRFRGYIYNFANLWAFAENMPSTKPIKPTVEFRQHDCTTEPGVGKHWIIFLEALVRVADEKSSQTTKYNSKALLDASKPYSAQQRDKYPSREGGGHSWAYDDIDRFCTRFLGLEKEEAKYWQGRFDLHAEDRPVRSDQ